MKETFGMKNLEVREKVVTARKQYVCSGCRGSIAKGERHTYWLQHTHHHGDAHRRFCHMCKPLS